MCRLSGDVERKLKQEVSNQKPEKIRHTTAMVQQKGGAICVTNEVEFPLYITLEYKVNKTQENVI